MKGTVCDAMYLILMVALWCVATTTMSLLKVKDWDWR